MKYQNKNLEYINAEEYDKRGENSIVENYVLRLWQPFLKNIIAGLSSDKIIVDLGCGTCEYAQAAREARKIYAVDISEEMLRICRKKLESFKQAEIINVSIENFTPIDIADLVIAIGIWEYANPEKLYEKIKDITQSGSKVIVVFPNIYNKLNLARSLWRMEKIALRPSFIKRLFKKEFVLVDSASFSVVSWVPKNLQFLFLPIWKFADWFWKPFQKFLPVGINVYYLFEKK